MATGGAGHVQGRLARRLAKATRRFAVRQDGASLVEYGLLLFLIAMLCLLAIKALGSKVANMYSNANSQIP
jgi:Flp pilus assembly pilin Flp